MVYIGFTNRMSTAPTFAQPRRWHLLLIPLAAFIVITPLLLQGCSCGHDFDFHTLNWMEVAAQWRTGILHPHWAVTAAYSAGEPRFVFYPPLSWTLGALLSLLFPWSATPILYTFLVLTGCGAALYWFAREWLAPHVAVLGAVLYLTNPYLLFTAYERTAYAELLAAVWIPLLLHGLLRYKPTLAGTAIPLALLWLSNAPAAVMGCYALALLAALRLGLLWLRPDAQQRTGRFAATVFAGTVLGLGLAAFYIVPAAYERRWVHIDLALLPGSRIRDNFLFSHTPNALHDQVLRTASWIAVGMLLTTAAATLLVYWRQHKQSSRADAVTAKHIVPMLVVLAIGIGFLLTPPSLFVWRHVPEMHFLQFPWRWLAVLGMVMAFLLARTLQPHKHRYRLLVVLCIVAPAIITPAAYFTFQQACDPGDLLPAQMQAFRAGIGVEPTDEYTPRTAQNEALQPGLPEFWLSNSADGEPGSQAAGQVLTTSHRTAGLWQLTVFAPTNRCLILRLRNYPAWQIRVNQAVLTQLPPRRDGLIAIPLARTTNTIEIRYITTTDDHVGETISLLALLILFLFAQLARRHRAHLSS